jgi:DNA polymerase II small subunit/DNA polymerase delta subunit B
MKTARTIYSKDNSREMIMRDGGFTNNVRLVAECGDDSCLCFKGEESSNSYPASHKEFVANVWKIMDELGNLMISKQLDYGPDNINNAHGGPINGLMVRLGDKFERLKNLLKKQQVKPQHEPIEDSFKDLANYGVIGLMIQRGLWPKE